MSIYVSTSSNVVSVTASAGGANVSVAQPATVSASIYGGQGPQGEPGVVGSLATIQDVELLSISDGDILRYSSSKWRNHPEASLVDGGNF